jgi:hypothetical protein
MSKDIDEKHKKENASKDNLTDKKVKGKEDMPKEKGGPKGPEPTRYGDWESKGKCVDF